MTQSYYSFVLFITFYFHYVFNFYFQFSLVSVSFQSEFARFSFVLIVQKMSGEYVLQHPSISKHPYTPLNSQELKLITCSVFFF